MLANCDRGLRESNDPVHNPKDHVVVQWRSQSFAELSFGGRPFGEVIPPGDELISPTVPFFAHEDPEDADIECGSKTLDQIRQLPTFLEPLTFVEQRYKGMKSSDDVKISAALAWENPPMIYNIEVVRDDPIGCLQTKLDELYPWKCQVYVSPVQLP